MLRSRLGAVPQAGRPAEVRWEIGGYSSRRVPAKDDLAHKVHIIAPPDRLQRPLQLELSAGNLEPHYAQQQVCPKSLRIRLDMYLRLSPWQTRADIAHGGWDVPSHQ
jgi:hypothetical protein